MASVKVKFRPSSVADREGTIYYQIIHERKVRQLISNYKVFPAEWDDHHAMVKTSFNSPRKSLILSIRARIRSDVERISRIVNRLDATGLEYTADDVVDEFSNYTHDYSLFNFMEKLIGILNANGKERTSETYRSALNSFRKFRKDEDIMLDSLTSEVMEAYEAWHHQRGNAPNTISFYTRILRAVYNRAVNDEIIANRYPFRKVYTGIDKTVKRALPVAQIKKIKGLDLSQKPTLDFARDMFLMSFYLRGMSFIDMAFLKKCDLSKGYISYRRRKTGQRLVIQWTREMQRLLDKYPENDSYYLLPVIRRSCVNARSVYRNVGYNINRNLKMVAEMVGVEIPLTLYVARHSWASVAKASGIPLSVISEGMGHDSEKTTRIYLASLEASVIDKANSKIINSLS